jgi:hypothetical protein
MAHIYFFLRGINQQVELTKIYLQSIFWKWRRINLKTKKETHHLVQGALRPSVLGAWEYVLPAEAIPEFCSIMKIENNLSYGFNKIGLNLRHFALRKIFGSKRIPKKIFEEAKKIPRTLILKNSERGLSPHLIQGVAFHLIGIKKDKFANFKHPIEAPDGYFQEML